MNEMINTYEQLTFTFFGAMLGMKLGLMLGEMLCRYTIKRKEYFTHAGGVYFANRKEY